MKLSGSDRPVVAEAQRCRDSYRMGSSGSLTSCGAPPHAFWIDSLHLFSSSMSLKLLCSRPEVSQRTTSISSLALASSTVLKRTSSGFMPSLGPTHGHNSGECNSRHTHTHTHTHTQVSQVSDNEYVNTHLTYSNVPICAFARFAHSSSCSEAAALKVSPGARDTDRPSLLNLYASFPTDVVLPPPFTPRISTTAGLPWQDAKHDPQIGSCTGVTLNSLTPCPTSRPSWRRTGHEEVAVLFVRHVWASRRRNSHNCDQHCHLLTCCLPIAAQCCLPSSPGFPGWIP